MGGQAGRRDFDQPLGGAAGQQQCRAPGTKVDDAHVAPEHPALQAGAERFRTGFLGGEALRIARGAIAAPLRPLALRFREDAIGEALAKPLQRLFDATNVGEVGTDADDQAAASLRAASIKARMRRMAASNPVKIASPIRKWPMLSSASSGMAAMAPTVS